jgi:hypothetical protein
MTYALLIYRTLEAAAGSTAASEKIGWRGIGRSNPRQARRAIYTQSRSSPRLAQRAPSEHGRPGTSYRWSVHRIQGMARRLLPDRLR